MVQINGFEHYFIETNGDVYSNFHGELKKLKPWVDGKGNYLLVGLCKNGKVYKKLIHRLVAEAYIPNSLNLPEVNHKDKNMKNPDVNNLEWCTRKENLIQSYETMSPKRYYKHCDLYYNNQFILHFDSIIDAVKYGVEHYDCKASMLYKYKKYKKCEIICSM